jgi:hypothetical protein
MLGQRHLEACRSLRWTDVPATAADLYQAATARRMRTVRKDLLPSEIVALMRAIEPLERREAGEHQGHKADLCKYRYRAGRTGARLSR